MKRLLLILLLLQKLIVFAQLAPKKLFEVSFFEKNQDPIFYKNKKMDTIFQKQIKTALLFYPELKNAYITFQVKKSKSPLSARPSIWAIFQKPENRRYIVIISTQTKNRLEPILLKNLSFNAQVGVLGHELSHVADFQQRKGVYFIKLLALHLSQKSMDTFENDTDKRCIEHGLGYQLLAWSIEVRQNLKIKQWHGANDDKQAQNTVTPNRDEARSIKGGLVRERYMSPQTIESVMKKMLIYK